MTLGHVCVLLRHPRASPRMARPPALRPELMESRTGRGRGRRGKSMRRTPAELITFVRQYVPKCFPLNVTLLGPGKSVTLSNPTIFRTWGSLGQFQICHIRHYVTLSGVILSGKHCATTVRPCSTMIHRSSIASSHLALTTTRISAAAVTVPWPA